MPEERVIPTPAPSDRPTFTILVEGHQIPLEYHVISLVVTKLANRISSARITFLDGDPSTGSFPASNAGLFVPGNKVEILAGYHSQESSIFQGIIINHGIRVRHGKPSTLVIECRHKAVQLSIGRKNAYYYDATDSQAIDSIIGRYSLAREINDTRVKHRELVQYSATDWDFILSRAEVNGMLVFTNNDKIMVKKPDFSLAPALSLLYGATILEFEAEMDARNQFSGVISQSWDIASQEIAESEGEEPSAASQGNIEASTLAGVIGLEKLTLQHGGLVSPEELQAWADAQMLKSRMSRVRGRVKFPGHAGINPGDILELGGVGERFNGTVFVSGVRHEIGEGTWMTDAQFGLSPGWFIEEHNTVNCLPASGLVPAMCGLQIGVVTQLQDDPDGEERVLVKMPLVSSDSNGAWARVATLDAGRERGSFFRPEIGDEVVLGFVHDDPRDPVILGMLNSSAKPAPVQAKDENHEKGFVTRSKMKLIFDDEKKSIIIETPAGKSVTISEDAGSILMKDENSNKIEMSRDGITIESGSALKLKASQDVSIEGTNITNKASAQFKAEGSAGAELSTSATAVIKGSLVQIN